MILDRFEGEYAICELSTNVFTQIKKSLVAEEAREGDVLKPCGERYAVDVEETAKRRARIRCKMDYLFQNRDFK